MSVKFSILGADYDIISTSQSVIVNWVLCVGRCGLIVVRSRATGKGRYGIGAEFLDHDLGDEHIWPRWSD